MFRFIASIVLIIALLIPSSLHAQSGDATWLNNQDGLETAIGRSWMPPMIMIEETVLTEFNEDGTPVSEIGYRTEPASTPVITDGMQTQMLSALIYEFDSEENAEKGIELFNAAQLDQISRDSRNPATNAFEPDLDVNIAYGNEGIQTLETFDGGTAEQAIVYVIAQHENLVYQVFGAFVPGNHIELATGVAQMMIDAEAGSAAPNYDWNGNSTGGLWEKLNAVEITMPEETTISDLEVYPVSDDAVMGDSVVVPEIDLDNLTSVPGITDSWHITYAPADTGVLISTPNVLPEGVFSIELWKMEFTDETKATAAAISFNNTLAEPLGIVSTEGGAFSNEQDEGMTLVGSGFVRDRAIPEGDAGTVVYVEGSTIYAARVYSNGLAPTPLAHDFVDHMRAKSETATGWDVFPQSGDDALYGLEPQIVRHENPENPASTPAG